MSVVVSALYLVIVHVTMSMLCRHFVRRRNFEFFHQHRAARGKPNSYGHFLLLYSSWLDPAMLTAAISRPGYGADQVKCGFLYGIGLFLAMLLVLLVVR